MKIVTDAVPESRGLERRRTHPASGSHSFLAALETARHHDPKPSVHHPAEAAHPARPEDSISARDALDGRETSPRNPSTIVEEKGRIVGLAKGETIAPAVASAKHGSSTIGDHVSEEMASAYGVREHPQVAPTGGEMAKPVGDIAGARIAEPTPNAAIGEAPGTADLGAQTVQVHFSERDGPLTRLDISTHADGSLSLNLAMSHGARPSVERAIEELRRRLAENGVFVDQLTLSGATENGA